MKDELIKLLDKAYAPYSKFQVAAIIEMKDYLSEERLSTMISQYENVEILRICI